MTKELVETLARARLDRMTSKQVVSMMQFADQSGIADMTRKASLKKK